MAEEIKKQKEKSFNMRNFLIFAHHYLWELVVISAFLVLIIALLADGYIFWKFGYESFKTEGLFETSSGAKVNTGALENTYQYIMNKEERFNKVISEEPALKDPSI